MSADQSANADKTDWDSRFLSLAIHIGSWSKDRSKGVGCVIVGRRNTVVSTGFNGFPRGVDDSLPERHARPSKYQWTEHAERNAIYNAAGGGGAVEGCRLYTQRYPCAECARGIVQAGIAEVICPPPPIELHEQLSIDVSQAILREGGVLVRLVSMPTAYISIAVDGS
ncbi:deoxycytidylate deaminase [Bradyrhizobium macuxiense]|uniref:deoxycytidylate deaminase n=1 Tax=Bradyrhizobium macuxiense TaxID=1755647 RepID=UPI0011BD9A8B|nr:deaminase [Bradyrhizobium macuxiense]